MITTAGINNNVLGNVLYMALELSQNKWCLAFGNGVKLRQVTLESNDRLGLFEVIFQAKEKLGLTKDAQVLSCYEDRFTLRNIVPCIFHRNWSAWR